MYGIVSVTIFDITTNRMAYIVRVDSYLVFPAGLKLELYK